MAHVRKLAEGALMADNRFQGLFHARHVQPPLGAGGRAASRHPRARARRPGAAEAHDRDEPFTPYTAWLASGNMGMCGRSASLCGRLQAPCYGTGSQLVIPSRAPFSLWEGRTISCQSGPNVRSLWLATQHHAVALDTQANGICAGTECC